MLAGLARLDDNLPPEQRIFLVPRAEYKVIDTWFAGGLRGTGSKDVEMAEVFVPEHMTLAVADTKGGPTPGSAVNPGPLFQLPVFALFPYMLSGVALGIAEGLIESYKPGAGKMTGARVAEIQSTQIRLAEATAYARASRVVQLANCREAEERLPDLRTKARYRLEGAYAVEWAVRAVDVMFGLYGAGGLYESGHVPRAFRDAHAVKQHFSFNTDAVAGAPHQVVGELRPERERRDLGEEERRDQLEIEHGDPCRGEHCPKGRAPIGKQPPQQERPERRNREVNGRGGDDRIGTPDHRARCAGRFHDVAARQERVERRGDAA
jgi:hypothetical protein